MNWITDSKGMNEGSFRYRHFGGEGKVASA